MAISVPNTASDVTVATSGTGTVTVARPANTVNGDTLLFFCNFRNASGTITAPSGSTLIGPVATTNQTAQAFIKVAASGETTYAFTSSGGSGRNQVTCCRVLGANTGATIIVGALSTPASESALTIPGITTTVANSGVFAFGVAQNASATGVTFAAPTGFTLISTNYFNNSTTSSSASMIAFQSKATAGAVGNAVANMTSGSTPAASNDQGWMIAFAPAVTTPPSTAYIWTGSGWVKHNLYIHNGTTWVAVV